MSEYIVDFGNKSTAFVGLAMAEAESHGANLMERVIRCRDCKHGRSPQQGLPWMCIRNCCAHIPIEPDGFCKWGKRKEDA